MRLVIRYVVVAGPKEHSDFVELKAISFSGPSFQLLIRTIPPPLLNSLHQFIQLSNLLITHLVHGTRIQDLPLPIIPLECLAIFLPFSQEADDMKRVLDILVSPEFSFQVCITEDALFGTQLCSMGAQETAVERDGWEKSEGWRPLARFEGSSGGRSKQTSIQAHDRCFYFLEDCSILACVLGRLEILSSKSREIMDIYRVREWR